MTDEENSKPCPDCNGSGDANNVHPKDEARVLGYKKCETCDGKGRVSA